MDTITVLPGISFKILHKEIFPTTKKKTNLIVKQKDITLSFSGGDYSLDYNDVDDDDDEKEKEGEKQKHDVEVVAND